MTKGSPAHLYSETKTSMDSAPEGRPGCEGARQTPHSLLEKKPESYSAAGHTKAGRRARVRLVNSDWPTEVETVLCKARGERAGLGAVERGSLGEKKAFSFFCLGWRSAASVKRERSAGRRRSCESCRGRLRRRRASWIEAGCHRRETLCTEQSGERRRGRSHSSDRTPAGGRRGVSVERTSPG